MTYYSAYKVNTMSYARSLLMFYSLRPIAPESKFVHLLHLDIFEHIIPPRLIEEVLTETQGWEEREKSLNMPMVIAIIIAMGLFASCSIPHVLHKLAQGLRYQPASEAVGRQAPAPLVRARLPAACHHRDARSLCLRLAADGHRQHGGEGG